MSDRKRILLVDDHQTVFHLLDAIVRLKEYQLLYAENGQQGIVMARQEKPDLILLDVMMPDIDGFRVCQYLKENPETKTIPVMLITARGAEGDLEAGRRAGADGFMTKPFQTIEVLNQIDRMLATKAS